MNNEPIPSQSKKALYLFLCSILGIILFLFIQQAFWVAYSGAAHAGYLPMLGQLNAWPTLTFLAAVLFGSWYGIWLGLYWYEMVYERAQARWFYAFGQRKRQLEPESELESANIWRGHPVRRDESENGRWQLDDLLEIETEAPPATVSKKRARPLAQKSSRPRKNGKPNVTVTQG